MRIMKENNVAGVWCLKKRRTVGPRPLVCLPMLLLETEKLDQTNLRRSTLLIPWRQERRCLLVTSPWSCDHADWTGIHSWQEYMRSLGVNASGWLNRPPHRVKALTVNTNLLSLNNVFFGIGGYVNSPAVGDSVWVSRRDSHARLSATMTLFPLHGQS